MIGEAIPQRQVENFTETARSTAPRTKSTNGAPRRPRNRRGGNGRPRRSGGSRNARGARA